MQKSRTLSWRRLSVFGTLAACLVLVVSAALLFRPDREPMIRVSGQKLTGQPLVLGRQEEFPGARGYSMDPAVSFTIPLEAEIHGRTAISALNGTMQIFDRQGSRLLYEGDSFLVEEDVLILWTVEADGDEARFEMRLEGAKVGRTVVLTYRDGGGWRICIEENAAG